MKRLLGVIKPVPPAATVSPEAELLDRWRRVADASPEDPGARLQIAEALRGLGREDELEAELAAIISRWPDNRRATVMLARQLLRRGDNERALERWLDIEQRWTDDPEYPFSVGLLLVRLGRPEEALERVEALEASSPDRAVRLRIKAYARLGRHAEAVELMEALRERRPLEAYESCELAGLYLGKGDAESALALTTTMTEGAPDHEEAIRLHISALERLGRYEEALETLDRRSASGAAPKLHRSQSIELLMKLARFDEADRACAAALERHPDDPKLLLLHARCAQQRFANLRAA